uniref:Uncharacterized protein n=1 Tax=Seriola lalandi dorsalis TaxID=1841481 RepID=A0A3B4Y8L8_SERLL
VEIRRELGSGVQSSPSSQMLSVVISAWVDEVWDLEFTERKSLDDAIEEELAASGDKAFRNLYKCLLAHAADQQQSVGTGEASQVKLICPLLQRDIYRV